MRSDAIEFRKDRTQVVSARRNRKTHHVLNRLNPHQAIRYRGNVIESIPVGRNHRVHAILGNFLHTTMQVADIAIKIDNRLAVELQDDAEHTVRRRMLRPHVEHHFRAIKQRPLGCGDFYLVHISLCYCGSDFSGQITTCNAPRLDYQANLCCLAALPPLYKFSNNRLGSARFVPNVSWRCGLR